MQRPRRTSEFHEESGTAKKNRPSSRSTQRYPTAPSPAAATGGVVGGAVVGGGTARKHASRQSRIALPTSRSSSSNRVSSSDRAAGSSLGLPSSSVSRGGVRTHSPQRTPLHDPKEPRRMLFTAEKQKTGGGGGGGTGAHNDKKWVQDQAQRINDYLCQKSTVGTGIDGIGQDFLSRSCGLRQMTIKQFIAIVNHFLRFLTRTTVKSTSYVEDIVNVLQKLRYPYQVNKSWLKTPTTQHSFGNVIVMLDFLMDLGAEEASSSSEILEFPLQEPQNLPMSASRIDEQQQLQIPDTEFQAQMLRSSEAGFMLWDLNRMDDFTQLKQQNSDLLIEKCSGVAGAAAIDAELAQLRGTLDTLVHQRPPIPKKDEDKCRQQKEHLNKLSQKLEILSDDYDFNVKQLAQMQTQLVAGDEKIQRLEAEVAHTQAVIKAQLCSVAERNAMIDKAAQLTHDSESQKRTLHDLQQRSYQQQVSVSRAKKQLSDQVEKFNTLMHDIAYSGMYTGSQDLQLPVQLSSDKELQSVVATLTALRQRTQTELQKSAEEQHILERQIVKTKDEIHVTLQPQSNTLSAAVTAAQERTRHAVNAINKERQTLDTRQQQLETQSQELQTQIAQIEQIIEKRELELKRLEKENENFMSRMEKEYDAFAVKREEHLKIFTAALENVEKNIKELQIRQDKKK